MVKKRADVVLVERGLFDSRARARAAIEAGGVIASGRTIAKPSELIEETAEISALAAHPYVGRGALKLVHALDIWPIGLQGRTALDVGASTGGFTEVCLERGAARVFAVDVGRGQLHPKLAGDSRVVSLEGVDARSLTPVQIPIAPDVIVTDVSFIGLAKALPAALGLARLGADLIALVKPQFEVGREFVGKGGIVKDQAARQRALEGVIASLQGEGWLLRETAESPISGGDGNKEFLLWMQKSR